METGSSNGPSSAHASPPSPTEHFQFALTQTGERPDPRTHAWREDLADVALAGQVISPHYAAPVARTLRKASTLLVAPSTDSEIIVDLEADAPFALLDSRGDWAWGYGGEERLVGYVPVAVLA